MNNKFHEYAIQLFIGEKRSGKTLTMVAETYENIIKHNPNIMVYSNFWLNPQYFPNSQKISLSEFEEFFKNGEEFKNCVFLIDEVHMFLDARNFMKSASKKIGYLLGQMGKRGNIFKANTHFPSLVDVRLRMYCERYIFVKKALLENGRLKDILNNNRVLTQEENKTLRIINQPIIRKLINFQFQEIYENPFVVEACKYFDLYDTEELVIDVGE